jgi:L-arabinose isomerase
LVNLAPGPDDSFSLVLSPVEVMEVDGTDRLENTVHGWFRPSKPIDEFLSLYSLAGGTHHLALVYGKVLEEIVKFGKLMGWRVVVIE